MSTSSPKHEAKRAPLLNMTNINPNLKNLEYAVRGPIVIRASEIEEELKHVSKFNLLLENFFTLTLNVLV